MKQYAKIESAIARGKLMVLNPQTKIKKVKITQSPIIEIPEQQFQQDQVESLPVSRRQSQTRRGILSMKKRPIQTFAPVPHKEDPRRKRDTKGRFKQNKSAQSMPPAPLEVPVEDDHRDYNHEVSDLLMRMKPHNPLQKDNEQNMQCNEKLALSKSNNKLLMEEDDEEE